METIPCDLLDPDSLKALPLVENVLFLAGRKFGSAGDPEVTWAMNTVVPVQVAQHFRDSRIVAFSTGNVYPLRFSRNKAVASSRMLRLRSGSTRNPAWDGSGSLSSTPKSSKRRA